MLAPKYRQRYGQCHIRVKFRGLSLLQTERSSHTWRITAFFPLFLLLLPTLRPPTSACLSQPTFYLPLNLPRYSSGSSSSHFSPSAPGLCKTQRVAQRNDNSPERRTTTTPPAPTTSRLRWAGERLTKRHQLTGGAKKTLQTTENEPDVHLLMKRFHIGRKTFGPSRSSINSASSSETRCCQCSWTRRRYKEWWSLVVEGIFNSRRLTR